MWQIVDDNDEDNGASVANRRKLVQSSATLLDKSGLTESQPASIKTEGISEHKQERRNK